LIAFNGSAEFSHTVAQHVQFIGRAWLPAISLWFHRLPARSRNSFRSPIAAYLPQPQAVGSHGHRE